MNTRGAIRGRTSTRAFLATPVPQQMIAQVLDTARWAPSASNRQPWRVTVAAGPTRDELAKRLVARARERSAGLSSGAGDHPEIQRRRQALRAGLARVAELLGVSAREFVVIGSYNLYRAPVVVVVSYLGTQGSASQTVLPLVTTMLLAAHDQGLGTCWLGYPLSYADTIREVLRIPDEETPAAVVALGYPDPDSPANAFRSSRDESKAFTRWVGFD